MVRTKTAYTVFLWGCGLIAVALFIMPFFL